jgi:hypothetical protein
MSIALSPRLPICAGIFSLLLITTGPVAAQNSAEIQQILARLERLEKENRALATEVRELRRDLSAARTATPVEEKLEIHEHRIEEHQQTKVETSQKYPLRVTGMALFNAFMNSKGAGGSENPTTASLTDLGSGGATFRQTVLGLQFSGPTAVLGAKVRGDFFIDFFSGSAPLNINPRIRIASISLDWKTRSLMVGQEKPLISPREPNSLSQVGVSPLTNAGNLWLWLPQARFEQRFAVAETSGVKAQFALFQTNETSASVPPPFAATLERARPALQGRFEYFHDFTGGRRFAIAPGFHVSTTHVAATSVPSRLVSLDWFLKPWASFEFTGTAFAGANVANMGSIRQGFTVLGPRDVIAIRSRGGWAQATWLPTDRLTFNVYAGQIDDNNRDLRFNGIAKNLSYAGNAMYRIAPNVILSLEAAKVRTTYFGAGNRQNNHYDLAVAYLF